MTTPVAPPDPPPPSGRSRGRAGAIASRALPPLLLLWCVLISAWALIDGGHLYHFDNAFVDVPYRIHALRAWRDGGPPHWTPLLQSGFPFLAEGQAGSLYPPTLALALQPTPGGVDLFALAHRLASVLFVYAWLLARLGPGARAGATLGAAAWLGLGLGAAQFPPTMVSVTWWPLALWLLERHRQGSRRAVWLVALVNALMITGGDQATNASLFAAEALYLLMVARRGPGWRGVAGELGPLGVIAVGPLLLAAPQIAPLYDYYLHSGRAANRTSLHEIIGHAAPLSPLHLGALLGAGALVWRRDRAWSQFWLALGLVGAALGAGLSPLLAVVHRLPVLGWFQWPNTYNWWCQLGVAGLVAAALPLPRPQADAPPGRRAVALTWLGVIVAALALADHAHLVMIHNVHGGRDLYQAADSRIIADARAAEAAGRHYRLFPWEDMDHGTERHGDEPDGLERRMYRLARMLPANHNLIHRVPSARLGGEFRTVSPRAAVRFWGAAGGEGGRGYSHSQWWHPNLLRAAAITAISAPAPIGVIEPERYDDGRWRLRVEQGSARIVGVAPRAVTVAIDAPGALHLKYALPPLAPGVRYRLRWRDRADAGGEERHQLSVVLVGRWGRQNALASSQSTPGSEWSDRALEVRVDQPVTPMVRVDLGQTAGQVELADLTLERDGHALPVHPSWPELLERVPASTPYYRLREPQPRAWVVHRTRHEPDEAARLRALLDPAWDPRAVALTETPVALAPPPPGAAPARVALREPDAARLELDVDAPAPGLLVVADSWHHELRATRDGEPVPLLRVNHAFRGVRVDAGRQHVAIWHEPRAFRTGVYITLAGLVILLTALLWPRRRASA